MPKVYISIGIIVMLLFSSCQKSSHFLKNNETPQKLCLNQGGFWDKALGNCIIFESIIVESDIDNDGIDDRTELIEGSRAEIKNKTTYKSAYYFGGYPPKNEGVCTDVIWRAFGDTGIDLKKAVDEDISKNTTEYGRVGGSPDPHIDFRRVPNLDVFFKKYTQSLDIQLDPEKLETLENWQGGDIIVFSQPNQHIAIVSDKRDENGVPYLIHNYSDVPKEDNWFFYEDAKYFRIVGHYRLKYGEKIWEEKGWNIK